MMKMIVSLPILIALFMAFVICKAAAIADREAEEVLEKVFDKKGDKK